MMLRITGLTNRALTGLRDSDGTLTDISVEWEAAHTGAYDGTDIPADGNAELYMGYLFSDGITPTTITISDIAYAQYDVYV